MPSGPACWYAATDMRRLVALTGMLVAGCKPDRPAQQAEDIAVTTAVPRDAAAASTALRRVPLPPTTAPATPTHVKLPNSPSTPPHRTTRPLARAELDRLSAIEFPDFEREVRSAGKRSAEIRHTTATRPKLAVTITLEPCDRDRHPCPAMELATWRARPELRERSLSKELREQPDTRFEIGARDVAGSSAIYTYQVGWAFGSDEHGQRQGSYSDAYNLYYNDGSNQIRVNASYADDAVGGKAQMLALAPEEDLEKLAVAFLSYYLHEWH